MAILSNFELLLNRIANAGDPTLPAASPFRRVVQGYFLTISNPVSNALAITFRVRFTVNLTNITGLTATELVDPNNAYYRGLIGTTPANSNHLLVVNREPDNNPGIPAIVPSLLTAGAVGATWRQYDSVVITIGVGQTYSVALLPNTQNPFVLNTANLAIRGYAEIESTSVLTPTRDLIITAEHRGTFLDNKYPSYSGEEMDFDQIAYGLPLFEGGSKVTVG